MQWSDVTAPPALRVLRQFALLWLLLWTGAGAWRIWSGTGESNGTLLLFSGALVLGAVGLWRPAAMRPLYTGWMVVAFPIGWTVSKIVLAAMFFLLFTPVALVFRLMRRDGLQLRRRSRASYWIARPQPDSARDYLHQF